MATTDISLVNNVVKITIEGYNPRQYSLKSATYAFNERSELQLSINGSSYVIPLADLRIGGSGSAPVSTAAALTSLSSTFPAWNQTPYTLNEILAEGNDAGGLSIENLPDPTTDQQVATKKYVDDNSGGGSSYLVKTYAQLIALINSNGLVAGTQYEISDFRTKHYIVDGSGQQYLDSIITGDLEPLIATAVSENKIDSLVKSTVYPSDIIHLDIDENNWLDDPSFSDLTNVPVIVTGWKGTITYRHDTLYDNRLGYDFRNVKFRRWKTDAEAWSGATTYDNTMYVTYNGFLYFSLQNANIDNQPDTEDSYWVKLLDMSLTEYWLPRPGTTNGIHGSALQFSDFKTFAEGSGSALYELCVTGNNYNSFKDTYSNFNTLGTLLPNNVFFLQDDDYFTVYNNSFGSEFMGNTFGNDVYENTVGTDFNFNIMGGRFARMFIGDGFGGNILSNAEQNNLGEGVSANQFGSLMVGNTFMNSVSFNKFGNGMTKNTIGNYFSSNTIAANFQKNKVEDGFNGAGVDFTGATYVYGDYNCTLFQRQGGGQRLSYFDSSDTLTVVAANA